VGRNLNQIARALNRGEELVRPDEAELQALLRVVTILRDQTKALIMANIASWEAGHEKTGH